MAWSYDVAQLLTSPLMQIRLEIGDTDTTDQLLQDEEIGLALAKEGDQTSAVAKSCELIARKFARLASTTLGPSKVEAQQRYEHYRDEALKLRKDSLNTNIPTAGGIYESEDLPDIDIKPLTFFKDMMNGSYEEE